MKLEHLSLLGGCFFVGCKVDIDKFRNERDNYRKLGDK